MYPLICSSCSRGENILRCLTQKWLHENGTCTFTMTSNVHVSPKRFLVKGEPSAI